MSVVRQEIGGIGRAKPAQYPYLFPYFTEIPKDSQRL
jgi:hypothetical protein